MGSHDPFGHLKHKLWSKERLRVKLANWLPTTKSQESTQFCCVQVACDIPLESSRRGLQLCFRSHYNQKSTREIMGPKVARDPIVGFRDSHLGVPGQNAIWMWPPWRDAKNIIRGKLVASPKSGPWKVLWVQGYLWLILTPKVLKLCTNQCVVWFVQIWMNE
jgi:hypothetical protein